MKSRPHKAQKAQNGFIRPKHLLCVVVFFVAMLSVFAATHPQWWAGRGVLNTNANIVTNDFAPATLGQLKWMATKARNEFDVSMPGGNWTGIHALVDGFANSNNYAPATVGQGKYVASKFYDRLVPLGYATNYPWSSDTADDNDFAPLLIGQLKTLFDFELQAGMQGLSNRAMPSAFQVQSAYGDLYLGPDFISGSTVYGQLSLGARLASLNSQDAQAGTYSGSSCELTHDDTPGFPGSSYTNFTSVWRDGDGVHVELNNASSNSGSPSNFCGSLQLYRAYFTNAVVVDASTGFSVSVSNETPERISWAGQASTNAGGHAHLLFQWKAPPIVLNPPYSVSLTGAGTNSLGAYMAVGETQPFTAHFSVAAAGTYSWTGTSHVSVSGGSSPNATVTASNASSSVGGDQVQCTFAPTGAENVCETNFPVTVISATVDIQSNYCMSCSGQTETVTVDLKPHDVSQGSLSVDVRNADGTVIEELAKNVSAGGGTHSYTWDAASVTTGAFKVHAEWSVDSAKATNERAVNANGVWFTTNNVIVAWTNGSYDAGRLMSSNSWAYDVFEWEVSPSGDASINPGTGELTFGANGGAYVVTAYAVDFSSSDLFSCSAVATVNVIKVDIVDEADNVLEGVQTNSVGEEISLKARIQPEGLTGWTYQWTIPGTAVTNYIIATDDSSAAAYPLNASHKTNAIIAFYWVDGATNREVKLETTLGGVTCEDIVAVDVQRPSVSNFVSLTGPVTVGNVGFGMTELVCGNAGTNGINYEAHVTMANFGGSLKFTQLTKHDIQASRTNNATESLNVPTWWLDTQDLAGGLSWPGAAGASVTPWGNDTPGVGLIAGDKKMEVKSWDFQLCLMFRPTGVGNSIWVPLEKLAWGWQGLAESTNGGITWSLTSGSQDATNPVGSTTLDFPEWSEVRTTNNPTWTSP